jgi:hypothetical protein
VTSDASQPTDDPTGLAPSSIIDPTKASAARVYDAGLGGKDNYAVDREVVAQIERVAPEMIRMARENRNWLVRVTRFLADTAGIDQFLDCGAGLPTTENTHQAAQRLNPEARVVYIDNDPVVAAHGRALLEENELTHLVMADLTQPDQVLDHPVVTAHLDFERPIALIQCSTIHHVPDVGNPHGIMQRYVERLPSGSYVALTHFCDPEDGGAGTELARFVEGVFTRSSMGSGYFRPKAQIEAFLDGLEFVPPGVTRVRDWWPDGPHLAPSTKEDEVVVGGVARKP